MRIDGTAAIVTGAGSGLGAATARHLAGQGARVAILDRDADRARAVAEEVGGRAYPLDVADAEGVGRALGDAAAALGPPRICVNCAGIGLAARMVNREGALSLDLFERTIRVNLIGTYTVMSHAIRHMSAAEPLDGERGVVVNTASVAFEDGQVGQTAYAASKGGIAAMCLPAAREMAGRGVRVCAIAPGLFRTPMMEALPEETVEGIVSAIPFPARLGLPEEFARLAGHIVGNPYLNGTTIRLDGAARLPPR